MTTTARTGELSIDGIACAESITKRIPYCWILDVQILSATDTKGTRLAADLLGRPGRKRWQQGRDYGYTLSTDARHLAELAFSEMCPAPWREGRAHITSQYSVPGGLAFVFSDRQGGSI